MQMQTFNMLSSAFALFGQFYYKGRKLSWINI